MDKSMLVNDLNQAVSLLREALLLKPENDVIKAGCIQYFEFCFELAWKTIKVMAEDDGISDCSSPKSALRTAFRLGWIDDEIVWLDMLMARNKMSHTYSAGSAVSVYERLSEYYRHLESLAQKTEQLL